jgi:hypothetical protein
MIKTLRIEKTLNSPKILMNAEKGIIEICGSSYLEDSLSFYLPVMEWIETYIQNPTDTTVDVELYYFNSSSAKILLNIFKSITVITKNNLKLTINWKYSEDDEDIRDTGISFAKLCNVDFMMIENEVVSEEYSWI